MKGLSQTLQLVVAAVIVLIVALVLLTIFGSGVSGIIKLTEAQSFCGTQGSTSCRASNNLPIDWNIPKYNVEEQGILSCKDVYDCTSCIDCSFQAG